VVESVALVKGTRRRNLVALLNGKIALTRLLKTGMRKRERRSAGRASTGRDGRAGTSGPGVGV
jgi:hypothetical protein